jgi:hypothetical protein
VAIRLRDFAVAVVDLKFGALVSTYLAPDFLSLGLGVGDMAGALPAISFDLPATTLVVHDAMGVPCHISLLSFAAYAISVAV